MKDGEQQKDENVCDKRKLLIDTSRFFDEMIKPRNAIIQAAAEGTHYTPLGYKQCNDPYQARTEIGKAQLTDYRQYCIAVYVKYLL